MRTLRCFVITPSGKNAPMQLVADGKDGLCRLPSGCTAQDAKVITVDFQNVYEYIIKEAIKKVNESKASEGWRIEAFRGEDLPQSGGIVAQLIEHICRADITITDVTGLNPNVLFEYGIRLSVRDSLNILLCHRGVTLPFDIYEQGRIEYSQDLKDVSQARDAIAAAIELGIAKLPHEAVEDVYNPFRRTVERATGRHLERKLTQAFAPAPALTAEMANELHRANPNPKLRDKCWNFLEKLAEASLEDPLGRERAIEVYRLLTTLEGYRDKRRDAFYKLNEICAVEPGREVEANAYLEQAKALES